MARRGFAYFNDDARPLRIRQNEICTKTVHNPWKGRIVCLSQETQPVSIQGNRYNRFQQDSSDKVPYDSLKS